VHVRSGSNTDELDELAQAYNAMVEHIQTRMEKIAESNALRRDLVAGVSHDLRTPLASLRGYLETLIMKNESLSPRDRRTYLEIASAQSDRMNRLVEELFELAKLEDVEIRIELEPFQLSELVQDVVQKFELVARDKGVTLAGQFTPDAPLVAGNIPLIERLLDNLLENAIRHTGSGGRIDVCVASGKLGPTIEVSDTGSGIDEGDVPHIFERFYRGDKSRSSESGGAGLGLAIAKRIIDLHDGRISVSSKVGVGSTFLVELPTRPH
jgi:signal transduction histidine kinase